MYFYVIGNGFDRHYGLKTSYCHFKKFLINNGYGELVQKVDRLFRERGNFEPDEIEHWSQFEDMLTSFNNLYADELYEEAMDNAQTDDERADYWDSSAWNVDYYNEYIVILKKQFGVWIKKIDTRMPRVLKDINQDTGIAIGKKNKTRNFSEFFVFSLFAHLRFISLCCIMKAQKQRRILL